MTMISPYTEEAPPWAVALVPQVVVLLRVSLLRPSMALLVG